MERAGRKSAYRSFLACLLLAAGLGLGHLARAHSRPLSVREGRLTSANGAQALAATQTQPGDELEVEPTPVPPMAAARGSKPPREPRDVERQAPPLRVLMVGNSYTMHNALHLMVQHIAASVPGGPKLKVDALVHGGYSLRNHWRTGLALARIRSGHYTYVVLQGHSLSALNHPDELANNAQRFKQAIDAAAGRTVLYATWARSPEALIYRHHKLIHSFEEMTERVESTYAELSRRLGTGLAPVGRAFQRALIQAPRLSLWGADGSHPTLAGSYTAACVLYGAITHRDPRASKYRPEGLTESQAALLRRVAAQTLHSIDQPTLAQPMAASGPANVADRVSAAQL